MNGFFTELGKKLAEQWLSLLVLPGAVFVAVCVAAVQLGHWHPFSVTVLFHRAEALVAHHIDTGAILVWATAVLVAAAAAGLAAHCLGGLVEAVWLAQNWRAWPTPARQLAEHATTRRLDIWRVVTGRDADQQVHSSRRCPACVATRLLPAWMPRRRTRVIAAEAPDRPTAIGDRVNAVAVRLRRVYGLEIADVWTYLWFSTSDTIRAELVKSRDGIRSAATLVGWAFLYLTLGFWWWPSVLIAAGLVATGLRRGRLTADAYSRAVEALSVLDTPELARALGLPADGPLDRRTGTSVTLIAQGRPELVALLKRPDITPM